MVARVVHFSVDECTGRDHRLKCARRGESVVAVDYRLERHWLVGSLGYGLDKIRLFNSLAAPV